MDEPFFLELASHARQAPLHPLAIDIDWRMDPASVPRHHSPEPPLMPYLLAAATALTGGKEWPTRLLFLPFDLAAAAALFLLAGRFLKRPLLPVLIVLASPAWLIDMGLLLPEKLACAFGLWGLYLLVRWAEEERKGLMLGSAAFIAAAVMSKYHAVCLAAAGAGFLLWSRVERRRILAWLALALAPLALVLGFDLASGGGLVEVLRALTRLGTASAWSGPVHTLRSLLAFTGGCCLVVLAWPFFVLPKPGKALAVCAGAAVLLFLPAWDVSAGIGWGDRLFGMLLACGAGLGLRSLAEPGPGRSLWVCWAAAVAGLELFAYWGVLARVVMFLAPPVVLGLAEALEARQSESALRRLYGASLAAVLALSLPLAAVDYRYAGAQRALARTVGEAFSAKGVKVWFTGNWGLRWYLEKEGARPVENSPQAWTEVGPGDVVVLSRVNANRAVPKDFFRQGRLAAAKVQSPIPLRLMSGWGAAALASGSQAGFYSNGWGFLPFAFSREPVDEFIIREPR